MKPLLSAIGLAKLRSLNPQDTIYAFDFDGTLAPLHMRPGGARTPTATLALLRKLNAKVSVAVITGRELRDLRPRLGFRPQFTIGNHGLEGLPGGEALTAIAKKTRAAWKKQLKKNHAEVYQRPGFKVEEKACSFTMHYRHVEKKTHAREWLMEVGRGLTPEPRLVTGKCVVNYIPVGMPHKGEALERLMHQARKSNAFFIGDDDTDEDVFRMGNPAILGVRVGNFRRSQAPFYVTRQGQVYKVIQEILKTLDPGCSLTAPRIPK